LVLIHGLSPLPAMAQAPDLSTMLPPSSRHTCRDRKKEASSNRPSPTDQLDYQDH
jgi:hypothetical protein